MPRYRYPVNALALFACGVLLSGCLGDPTYGTGTTQSAQLAEDIGNLVTLPKNKAADINYKPRPGIVQPPKSDQGELPPPQQSVASAGNPAWPQSPEDVRKRMEEKIDQQTGNTKRLPLGTSPRMQDGGSMINNTDQETKEFREALSIQQGTYSGRRFMSDPPSNLQVPASTAPSDELGTPEKQKERERLAAAKKKKDRSWWPF